MSNVKNVEIDGWMPFDGGQHLEVGTMEEIIGVRLIKYLGQMNLPVFNLRVRYLHQSKDVPSPAGGKMFLYWFQIRGSEAVSEQWLTAFCKAVEGASGEIIRGIAYDEENSMEKCWEYPV